MKAHSKDSKDKLKMELTALADLAVKEEGTRYSIDRPEEVLKMLKWASGQSDAYIRRLLPRVGKYLNSGHRRFFESNGISFAIFPDLKDDTLATDKAFNKIGSASSKTG